MLVPTTIDHTAIVVDDTAQSLKFYRDLLGIKLAGESMNHGTEQEHLNNVAGARLRISGLRPKMDLESKFSIAWLRKTASQRLRTPAPTTCCTGKPYFATPSVATAAQKIRSARVGLVSPGPVAIPEKSLGSTKVFLVRDPDGHGLHLIEKLK